jgi:hypothetical protein
MQVFSENLPLAVHSKSGVGQYRAAVCQHFHLHFKRIGGSGNCFFETCAALLPTVSDAIALRQQVIAFLRECVDEGHGALGQRCLAGIEEELNEELIGGKNPIFPLTAQAYLDASASPRIWVAGYHWLRAVSALHNVCIGVVIHGFEYVMFIGDPSLPRRFVYKKDPETHYDALLPAAAPLPGSVTVKITSSSSCSSECDIQDPIPAPLVPRPSHLQASNTEDAAPLPPSGRPRRTARMSCKAEVSSSSSYEDDSPAPQSKATRKRAQQRTKLVKADERALAPSAAGVHLAPRPCHLQASNTEDAKKELKVLFDNSNGHSSRVINSREIPRPYFLLKCKGCGATCTATKKVGWQVVSWDDKACAISPSVSVPSVSVVSSVLADGPKQMPEKWECCMMHDATGPRVVCMNPRKPHNQCVECFEHMVNDLTEGENRAAFIANGAKVLCFGCKNDGAHAFDMRVCASFLSEALYNRYVTCLTDAAVIKTQKEYEARLQRALASTGGGAASAVDTASEFTAFFVPSRLSCFISQANSSSIFPLN